MSVTRERNVTKIDSSYVKHRELNEVSSMRKKKLLLRRLSLFLLIVAGTAYLMISTLISQSSAIEDLQSEKKELDQQLGSLKKKETILKEEIVKLNDDEYIAKLARKDYFLSEKGEIIFNLPEEEKKEKSTGR